MSKGQHRQYMTMVKNKPKTKQEDTTKKAIMLKHQVTRKTTTDSVVKIGEEISVTFTWYRVIELQNQKWVEFEQGTIPS